MIPIPILSFVFENVLFESFIWTLEQAKYETFIKLI